MEFGASRSRGTDFGDNEPQIVRLQEKGCQFWLRVGPLRGCNGAAAITAAATGVLDYGLPRF
ncbi:MAG: hypothetical protein WCA99_12485 [Candidatus Sulfotelmatobacter sp.]